MNFKKFDLKNLYWLYKENGEIVSPYYCLSSENDSESQTIYIDVENNFFYDHQDIRNKLAKDNLRFVDSAKMMIDFKMPSFAFGLSHFHIKRYCDNHSISKRETLKLIPFFKKAIKSKNCEKTL